MLGSGKKGGLVEKERNIKERGIQLPAVDSLGKGRKHNATCLASLNKLSKNQRYPMLSSKTWS